VVSLGTIVFSIYMALVIVIGYIASRHQNTSEDFWVAGRRFGIGLPVVAEMASVLHGGSVQGGVALAARFGGVAVLPFISFAIAPLIVVRLFAKKAADDGGLHAARLHGRALPERLPARLQRRYCLLGV
jgi:Na+/proline symporter